MTSPLDLKARATAAQQRYEEAEARLYRTDGAKLYGDEEHEERLSALDAERREACQSVVEAARSLRVAAEEEIGRAKFTDHADRLTPEELEEAGRRLPFSSMDAESLPEEELAGRLESVLTSGNKGTMYAWYKAASQRRRRIIEGRRETLRQTGQSPAAVPSATALDAPINKLGATLDPGAGSRLEEARRREREALRVEMEAGNLARGSSSSAAGYVSRRMSRLSG